MLAVIDTRPSYLDENGDVLAAGRLIVYKFGTTELADIFQDQEFTLPLANPLGLSSASWTSTQVYANEAVTVLAQKYEGLDEFGQEIFSTVKTYDVLSQSAGSGTSADSLFIVDNVEDLRNYEGMEDTQVILVKGYVTPTDCYVRKYIWSESSMTIDNGGTVLTSNTSPTGRWILLYEGRTLDIRAFGVLPSATDVNSQFRAACNWATTAKCTLVIPTGTYSLTSSGTFDCYAALEVAEGVRFQKGITLDSNKANWYYINLYNPHTKILGSFGGTCCRVTINGLGWENVQIPFEAFHYVARGYSHGTANFHLVIDATVPTANMPYFEQSCSFSAVSVAKTLVVPVYIDTGVTVAIDHLEGPGQLSFNQTNTVPTFRELRTSLVTSRASYCMASTTEIVYLDSAVSLHSGATVTAYVEASGAGTLNTPDQSCKMTGGYGGKPNFIVTGYGLDVGYHTIRQDYFASAEGLVRTWNLSSGATGILDLGRAVATETVERAGTIYNGTIGGVSAAEIILDNVTVNGNVDSTYVRAKSSVINGTLPNLAGSNFDNVTINTTSVINCSNAVWREVSIPNGHIRSYGGGFRIKDVFCLDATFIPNANRQFTNASWEGGSARGISFDAAQMSTEGTAQAYNVIIKSILWLPNNISATDNGSTKKWLINGHYNIQIMDNEGVNTRRTIGTSFALLNWRYNQQNSNSTLAGWAISCYGSHIFRFRDGSGTEGLQLAYLQAEKAEDTATTQFGFFPANVYKPYPSWNVVPCMQMRGNNVYLKFYVGAGAASNGFLGAVPAGQGVYANPGTVNAQHYCLNFKVYP